MNKHFLFRAVLTCISISLFTISCDTGNSIPDEPVNEYLVSDNFRRTITQQQLEFFWSVAGVPEVLDYISYDIDVYTVAYNTTDDNGNPVIASGAVLIPKGIENPGLLSVQHATIFSNAEAPSVDVGISVTARKSIFASAGYVTFLPDYLGYGLTEEMLHPYQQESTLASASYDMILAGFEFMENRNLAGLNQPLNLIGYSEGAYATVALAKKMEQSTSIIDIGLVSVGAPIFDLTSTFDYIIENISEPMECVACYAYFLYTYHQIYDLPRPLSDYFNSPYDQEIAEGLFSGENSGEFVRSRLPESAEDLFTQSFIERYRNGEETDLMNAVAENDLLYIPEAELLLVHGDEDAVAPVFNSDEFEIRALDAGKTNLTYIREVGVNHVEGFVPWGLETLRVLSVKSKPLAVIN